MNNTPRLGPSYRWIILGCCVVAYATSYLTRWSYTGLASFISRDLHLDKGALGLLGSAFFYTYAFAQIPWGQGTDRWGGRVIISLGVILSAIGLACFATAQDLGQALAWRMIVGVVAASAFVPIACVVGQWFAPSERGLANGVYYGLGGGIGQGAAFLLLPLLHVYFLAESTTTFSGWRGAMWFVSLLLLLLGVACMVFLRSLPQEKSYVETQPLSAIAQVSDHWNQPNRSILGDPVLWLLGGYFAAGIIALRLVPGWLIIYASDVFQHQWQYSPHEAIIAGGTVGVIYTVGHIVGSPLVGQWSDRAKNREANRLRMASCGLGIGALMVWLLSVPHHALWLLGVIALLLGVTLHLFPILNAAVTERWGAYRTGHALGWINMIGQLAGAVSLSMSGFIGLAGSRGPEEPLSEYVWIWYLAGIFCMVGAGCGWGAYRLSNRDQLESRQTPTRMRSKS